MILATSFLLLLQLLSLHCHFSGSSCATQQKLYGAIILAQSLQVDRNIDVTCCFNWLSVTLASRKQIEHYILPFHLLDLLNYFLAQLVRYLPFSQHLVLACDSTASWTSMSLVVFPAAATQISALSTFPVALAITCASFWLPFRIKAVPQICWFLVVVVKYTVVCCAP